jgi:hypothetical protein
MFSSRTTGPERDFQPARCHFDQFPAALRTRTYFGLRVIRTVGVRERSVIVFTMSPSKVQDVDRRCAGRPEAKTGV